MLQITGRVRGAVMHQVSVPTHLQKVTSALWTGLVVKQVEEH